MSSSVDAGDLTSDSQSGRPEDSLFSTTAPEPLLRRVSHSSASSSTHSQQPDDSQDPSYSREEQLDTFEHQDLTQDDASIQTPARGQQKPSMAGSHASIASTATAVGGHSGIQDGSSRQTLTLREQEKVHHGKQSGGLSHANKNACILFSSSLT